MPKCPECGRTQTAACCWYQRELRRQKGRRTDAELVAELIAKTKAAAS